MAFHTLLTQHELDPLIGERNRQRWQAQQQLAPAFPVDVFGRKLRIFPEFALGQVVARGFGRRQQLPAAVSAISRATQRLYEAGSFRALAEVVHRHLRELEVVNAATLTELLLAAAPQELRALGEEMEAIELALREHAVVLEARPGRISALHVDAVIVELLGPMQEIAIARQRMAGDLPVGAWVLCERVSVGTLSDEFVLPSVTPRQGTQLDWKQAAGEQLDAQLQATRRDDGSLEPEYAFLLWEDGSDAQLDRFERQARDVLHSAHTIRQWQAFLDEKRASYAALPAFVVPPANDAPSGPVECIDGYLSGGDWRSVLRDTRNPFATARER
jgi:hypothetical protein